MPRQLEYRDLEPAERRSALMRAAGASLSAIALELGSNCETVRQMLQRPRVASFLLRLQAMVADGIEDMVEVVNDKIRATANRAFDVEARIMDDLVDLGEVYDEPHAKIRAKLGAVTTAQDILDRAGNRAPTKVLNAHMHATIPPSVLENLVDVLNETAAAGGGGVGGAPGLDAQAEKGAQNGGEQQMRHAPMEAKATSAKMDSVDQEQPVDKAVQTELVFQTGRPIQEAR